MYALVTSLIEMTDAAPPTLRPPLTATPATIDSTFSLASALTVTSPRALTVAPSAI